MLPDHVVGLGYGGVAQVTSSGSMLCRYDLMTSDLEALSPAGNGSRLDSSCLELLNAREPHVNKELPVVRKITLIEDDGLTLNVNG